MMKINVCYLSVKSCRGEYVRSVTDYLTNRSTVVENIDKQFMIEVFCQAVVQNILTNV